MKEELTNFKCDMCDDNKVRFKDTGYPYEDGWVYIHKYEIKKHNVKNNLSNVKLFSKHFCSQDCMDKFIQYKFEEDDSK